VGEKKRRIAAQKAGSAPYYAELIRQAFRALESGDQARAAEAFFELFTASPSDPGVLHGAGLLGIQIGQPELAEKLLLRAIEQRPDHPVYRCNLAIAYRHLGKPGPAIEQLNIALGLDSGLAEAHATLGNLLLDSGNMEAAARSFERALAIRREYPDALNGLGSIQRALGQYDGACAKFELALAIDPTFHQAHSNLAAARFGWAASLEKSSNSDSASFATGHAKLGIESISTALRLCPDNPAYWAQFAGHLEYLDLRHPIGERARELLLRALDHPAVEPAKLVRSISSLACTHPSALEIERQISRSQTFERVAWSNIKHLVDDVFGDTLLLRLIEDVVIRDAFLERLIAFSRRATLDEILERPAVEPSLPLEVITAIAHQSFNTEYVYEESAEERSGVETLRNAILSARTAGEPVPLRWYAISACYRPLHLLDGPEQIAADLAPTPLRSLAVRQILEPLEERRLRSTIPALTGTAGGVSLAVQAQYEANPYPRWLRTRQHVAPGTVAGILRRLFPMADLDEVTEAPAGILIAGCGTGLHPITTARRFKNSSVLAVDLSLTSLAYAKRKTREFGIADIEYRQGDILALDPIPERFDVIECSGVLHHLEDPLAGWRLLCSLLRPGGVMRVGLYSEIGRRHVARAREFVAAQGFEPTPEGIRQCRAAILARGDDELLARTAKSEDFYSLSGCRDLIFHVREHLFRLPQIAALIEGLGLRFIGFELPDSGAVFARYQAQFPDDPALANLEYWHRFELANPETFARMYQFWVRRNVYSPVGNLERN
jgi:tetratricopeptide (TPR) repeat protein/2-polyprenyl-3-methyl-5-hydroxy-6-metoxy-1,4-benzoquinol methylase